MKIQLTSLALILGIFSAGARGELACTTGSEPSLPGLEAAIQDLISDDEPDREPSSRKKTHSPLVQRVRLQFSESPRTGIVVWKQRLVSPAKYFHASFAGDKPLHITPMSRREFSEITTRLSAISTRQDRIRKLAVCSRPVAVLFEYADRYKNRSLWCYELMTKADQGALSGWYASWIE